MGKILRYALVLVVMVLLLGGLFAGQSSAANRVPNPDFEQWTERKNLPDGWYLIPTMDQNQGELAETVVDARGAYHGSYYVKLVAVRGHRMHEHKVLRIEQGQQYRLSVWARGKGQIALGVYEYDERDKFLLTVQDRQPDVLTGSWRRYTFTYTPHREKARKVRYFVWVKGIVFLDMPSLVLASEVEEVEVAPHNLKPLLSIPYLKTAPVIDGKLHPEEWKYAARITGFLNLSGKLAQQQTTVYAGFDNDNLYIAFTSHSPSGIKAEVRKRDGRVFGEDAFEVFIQPNLGSKVYYQFAGNAIGTQYDAMRRDSSWDADWKLACSREYDEYFVAATWTAEIAIPFKSLDQSGRPADGTRWGVNFCRDWARTPSGKKADREERWTTWAPVGGNFHNPRKFGTLVFHSEVPAVQLEELGDLPRGYIALAGNLSAQKKTLLTLTWTVFTAEEPVKQITSREEKFALNPRQTVPFRLEGELDVAGTKPWPVILLFSARDEQGQIFLRNIISYEAIPAFRVDFYPVYNRGFLEAKFDIRRLANIPAEASGGVKIMTKEGKSFAKAKVAELGSKKEARVRLDISKVPPGDYLLKASLQDAEGTVIAAKTAPLLVPESPEWLGNKLGISEDVPPPYTDLKTSGREVSVWGRVYRLGELLLPSQISIQGTEFLSAPIRLIYGDMNGRKGWTKTEWKLKHARATEAFYEFRSTNATANITGSLKAEYDGFLLFDITVAPRQNRMLLSELSLEIPLYRKMSPFLRATTGPITKWGASGAMQNALIGDVKPKSVPEGYSPGYSPQGWNWGKDFIPQFWVGDDYRGLFYFQDSQKDMSWEGSPLEVIHKGEVTLLRLYFINKETAFNKPLHYRFALQATPVRKRIRRLERLVYGAAFGGVPENLAKHGVPRGIIPAGVHWKFGRIEKDYVVKNPNALRHIVERYRKAGVELLVNHAVSFFVQNQPEFNLYGSEWMQQPPLRYPNHQGTDLTLVKVCPQSSFPDYYLWWLKGMIEKYGIGGVYLDLSGVAGCSNPYHGHGYEKNGQRYMTSDMFAAREFYKRLYTFLKEEGARRGREFYVFQHSAAGIITPFVDMMTVGEGWSVAENWETLTPTYFRAAESWRMLGIPYTFFPTVSIPFYRVGKYCAPHYEILARALIHDVLPVAIWSNQLYKDLVPIWQAWEDFGVQEAEWVPYFEKDSRVKVTPGDLLASFYLNKGKLMVVVSNLTKKEVKGKLELDRKGLGLPVGKLSVKEIRSGDKSFLEGETLPLKVGPTNLVILRIN